MVRHAGRERQLDAEAGHDALVDHLSPPRLSCRMAASSVTLRDAGAYITNLPKSQHDSAPWQNAMHVLIQAADHGGPIEFARLGMMQALYPKRHAGLSFSRQRPEVAQPRQAGEGSVRDEIGPFQVWRILLALAVTAGVIGAAYLTIAFMIGFMK